MAGDRKSPEVRRGLDYLHGLGNNPFNSHFYWFYYGNFYAVQAMYQASERDFLRWYPRLRDAMLEAQHTDGGRASTGVASRPAPRPWSRPIPTATARRMAILILGVPIQISAHISASAKPLPLFSVLQVALRLPTNAKRGL